METLDDEASRRSLTSVLEPFSMASSGEDDILLIQEAHCLRALQNHDVVARPGSKVCEVPRTLPKPSTNWTKSTKWLLQRALQYGLHLYFDHMSFSPYCRLIDYLIPRTGYLPSIESQNIRPTPMFATASASMKISWLARFSKKYDKAAINGSETLG